MASHTSHRWLRSLAILGTGLLILVVTVLALLQVPTVATWVMRRIVTFLPLNPGYQLEVGRVSGDWLHRLRLDDVRLVRQDRVLARLDRLTAGYDLRQVQSARPRLRDLNVEGGTIVARREGGGWDLAKALRQSEDTTRPSGAGFTVERLRLRDVELAAQLSPDSAVRVRGLDLRARDLVLGSELLVTVDQLNAAISPPASGRWFAVAARGAVGRDALRFDPLRIQTEETRVAARVVLPRDLSDARQVDRLELRLNATPLALSDLAAVVPGITPEDELYLDASADGTEEGLVTTRLGARLGQARVVLNGAAPVAKGASGYRLRGTARRLDPSRLYQSAPAGEVNADVEGRLAGTSLERSDGTVALRLTDSRLGGTPVQRLDLRARLRQGLARVRLRGVADRGTIALHGSVRPFDSIPEYRLTGSADGLPGSDALARTLAGDSGSPALEVSFHLAGSGFSPASAEVTGGLELAARRNDGERVSLGRSALALHQGRLLAGPTLNVGGGRISARAVVQLGDTIRYRLDRGKLDQIDLGSLLQDTTAAPVSGTFSLSGKGISPGTAEASAHIELPRVSYAARTVEQVNGTLRLARGRAVIDLRGLLQGGRLALQADARPFGLSKTLYLRRATLTQADLGSFLGRPDLAGPVTLRITGSGRSRGDERWFQGHLVLEPSRLGRFRISRGAVALTMDGDRLKYDGSVLSNAGVLALDGEAHDLAAMPTFSVVHGRADSLDLGTLAGRPDIETAINARFTGTVRPGSADSAQARLSLDLLPSSINRAQVDGGRLDARLERGVVQSSVRVTGRDGELTARLEGQNGDTDTRLHAEGDLRLERLSRWVGRADAEGRVESRFGVDLLADSAGLVSLSGAMDAVGGIGRARVTGIHLALRPEAGAIHLDTLIVRSNVLAVDGGGRIALRESAGVDTLRITGEALDIGPIAALAGADSVTLDSGRVAIAMSGPAARWRVEGKADIYRILSGSNLAERLAVQAGATVDSGGISRVAGELRLTGGALGTRRIPEARITGSYDSVFTAEASIAVGDSVRLAAALRGAAGRDTVRAVLQRLDLNEAGRQWSLEQPADLMFRPHLVVDGFGLRSGDRRVLVDGVFDPRGSSDMTLRLSNLDLDVFRAVRLSPIGGRLDGWLRLTGPAEAPSLIGSLGLGIRRGKETEVGQIRARLDWTREGLTLDAAALPRQGGRLTVSGTFPWRLTFAPADTAARVGLVRGAADTLGLVVRADSFDLGVFEPLLPAETAREIRGRLVADARVGGKTGAPRANGMVQVTGAGVTLPTLDVSYRGGELLARLAGDQLRIERLRLLTGKHETLTAQGTVNLRPITDPGLNLSAELNNFRVSHSSSLQAMASGKVQLGGKASRPSLTGRLTMGRTDLIIGGGEASASVEPVELSPAEIREVARRFGPAAVAHTSESQGLVDRFHLDLDLRLPRRVWFRKRTSPKAEIELSGRIRLRQEPGEPMQFFGRVEPIPGRGGLDVYGREFRLIGGDIALNGPTDSTLLDLTAQYQVPTQGGPEDEGVLIEVAARGHPDSISLEFRGDPEMSQDDMLSYIVTGRPASDNPLAEQSGQKTSAGEMGAAVALSGLTQSLSNAAEEELGLDVFQIRQEGLRGMNLTAGRYVGSRVFLSLHLPIELGGEAEQDPGTGLGPSFELEYVAQRWLRANIVGGSVPPRFTLRSRYAY